MNANPLADIAAQMQKQKADKELEGIKQSIVVLQKEIIRMEKLIELNLCQSEDSNLSQKKVSINPKYIAYVEEDDAHSYVHMSNESVLHTMESRNEILKLIEGSANQTYIS